MEQVAGGVLLEIEEEMKGGWNGWTIPDYILSSISTATLKTRCHAAHAHPYMQSSKPFLAH